MTQLSQGGGAGASVPTTVVILKMKEEENMMKFRWIFLATVLLILTTASAGFCAYHHEGEHDAERFLSVYPGKAGTKLDHCALCHTAGQYQDDRGRTVSLGSCQWCHYTYGYDGSGNILDTMNDYGRDYHDNGRNAAAVSAIENLDSDADGYTNIEEIQANRFPGDAGDDPSQVTASYRIYTKAQLKALGGHTQFLLMNTSRSGDYYAEYSGVPVADLLTDAGIVSTATGITVFSPDGWAQYHPLEEDPGQPEFYHVKGTYPDAVYHYQEQADVALNPNDGWCDYGAPSCAGRDNGDAIVLAGGYKMILAYQRESEDMDPGILNKDNKLDGEGPFRVVPPQKSPSPPDQSSRATNQSVVWPYDNDWDHNAGSSTRTVTIIRVEPLPAGTTDIDVLEAGWAYVDQEKVIIYGAIDGTDSNGNGVLDSEEGTDSNSDYDNDGTPDFQDPDTAWVRHANGVQKIMMHTSDGEFSEVKCLGDDDPEVSQTGKPSMTYPYGTNKLKISGLAAGQSVVVTLVYPDNVPTTAKYYKISAVNGWQEIPFASNNGDNTIMITLTDGDALTDADGLENGEIDDPGALATTSSGNTSSNGGGGGGCFISSAAAPQKHVTLAVLIVMLIFGGVSKIYRTIRGG